MVRSSFPGLYPLSALLLLGVLAHCPGPAQAQLVWELERSRLPDSESQFEPDSTRGAAAAVLPPLLTPPPPVATSLTWELEEPSHTPQAVVANAPSASPSEAVIGLGLASGLLWEVDDGLPSEIDEQLLALDVIDPSEPANSDQPQVPARFQDLQHAISTNHSSATVPPVSVNVVLENSIQSSAIGDGTGMAGILRVTWGQAPISRSPWF